MGPPAVWSADVVTKRIREPGLKQSRVFLMRGWLLLQTFAAGDMNHFARHKTALQ